MDEKTGRTSSIAAEAGGDGEGAGLGGGAGIGTGAGTGVGADTTGTLLEEPPPSPPHEARCLIPRFDGAILSLEWKEAVWDKFVMGAPRPRTPSEQQYSDRKLRSRR